MAIMASKGSGGNYKPCPTGSHAAVCCDVVDLGNVKTNFGGKEKTQHKVNLVWQVDERRDDGKPFLVFKRYTLSLHEKAALRKDLESWRGRAFTEEELEGFDLENLLGAPAMLSVVHNAQGGNVYANVSAIMKLPRGMNPLTVAKDYVRVVDRPGNAPPNQAPFAGADEEPPPDYAMGITDDDVPF